jgi:type I restriction enzyme S subunit
VSEACLAMERQTRHQCGAVVAKSSQALFSKQHGSHQCQPQPQLNQLVCLCELKVDKQLINKNNKKIYFKDLGKVIRGVGYKPENLLDEYNDQNCIILRSNNIFESNINYNDIKVLSLENVKKEQVLIDGDFAICMSNGSKELVGKSAQYISSGKNVSIGSFCAGFRPNSILSRDLIEHLFASESYRQAIKIILTGSAINNLKPFDIEEMSLRIENDKIKLSALLSELKSISNYTIQLDSKIKSSHSLQKSIINQIF